MKKTYIGVAITIIVLWFWGFAYWGFGPYGNVIWNKAADDVAAGEALRQHFPENGTYYVPAFPSENTDAEMDRVENLFKSGPVAFVHMLRVDGRDMMDMGMMVQGFILNAVVIVLITVILTMLSAALPSYADRMKLVALVGLTSVLLIDFGQAVWWGIDWPWKLYQAFYNFSVWIVCGLILAKFIESPGAATESAEEA